MSALGTHQEVFVRVLNEVRSSIRLIVEQPSGSWAYKQPGMIDLALVTGLLFVCQMSDFCSILFL